MANIFNVPQLLSYDLFFYHNFCVLSAPFAKKGLHLHILKS